MKANVPTRKKIKLEWFKSKCEVDIERKIELEYTSSNILLNEIKWNTVVKYMLIKEGESIDIPSKSPMTFYKNGLPFLFLSTANNIGNKIISEALIDEDIVINDDIVQIKEGKPEITFEDAIDPKEQIEVRTRYDAITRKINVENKLDTEIEVIVVFKQTKEVTFVKADPKPSEIEEPNYKFKISIPSGQSKKTTLDLQGKIVSRVTKIRPEFLRPAEKSSKFNKI